MSLFASLMRTLVPIVVGLVLGLAAKAGLELDDATTTTYVTAAMTAGYYAAFRGLEELAAHIGWRRLQVLAGVLLGWARPPQYPGGNATAIRQAFTLDVNGADADAELLALFREYVRKYGAGGIG